MAVKSRKPKPARKSKRGKKAKIDKAPEIAVRKRKAGSKVNEESKALFLDHHLPKIARLREVVNTAQANLRNGYKTAKKDGFLQRDFDIAFKLKTQTGEREIKATIARDMTIAKWLGYALGKQLDLFVEADEHDLEMQAYADGEEASRTNKPAAPLYAPETVGYEAYMRGFHDHQETLAQTGIKQDAPSSGVPMTRSQFKAQQAAARAAAKADKYIEPKQDSMFTKRTPDEAA